MKKIVKSSALISKYSEIFQKNPRSRVFAPLAEAYRTLGMYDEALKILRNGIKHHSEYTLGYIVLAQVYFDLEKYELAYSNLRPFVNSNLDNPTLQKVFAETCYKLNYNEESLTTYKYLLFLNPKDALAIQRVKELEDEVEKQNSEIYPQSERIIFNETQSEDDWVQMDMSQKSYKKDKNEWSMKAPADPIAQFKADIKNRNLNVVQRNLDDEYFTEEESSVGMEEEETEAPFINHTLVDLYLTQKHYEKAQELLESILKLHPGDEASKKKLKDVQKLKAPQKNPASSSLSDFIQSEQVKKDQVSTQVKEKYTAFLLKLQKQAQEKLKTL